MVTDKRPVGRPNKLRAEGLTEKILDGARLAFSRKGVAGSSIDDIALNLGISKHTIYRRFSNKIELLEAVVARDVGHFRERLLQASTGVAAPLEALRRTALSYFMFGSSRDYSAFYLSVNAEAAVSAALRERLAKWSSDALAPMVNAVVAAQSAEAIKSGDPRVICDILVDLIEGANNRVRLRNHSVVDGVSSTTLFDERWSVFLSGLCVDTI